MNARDNVRPGISRMFAHRLVLRVQEMLQAIKRCRLPGVKRTDQVKTHGSVEWQLGYPIHRLMVTRPDCDWAKSAAHAVSTLLQGSKGQKQAKTQADLLSIARLSGHAPQLTSEQVATRVAEIGALVSALRTAGRATRVRRVVPSGDVGQPAEEGDVDGMDVLPLVELSEACPEASEPVDMSLVRSGSAASTTSTSSTDSVLCESDGTVSECDSRSDCTDDSDAVGSEVATDPYGFSPEPYLSGEDSDAIGVERAPSPACSSGSG